MSDRLKFNDAVCAIHGDRRAVTWVCIECARLIAAEPDLLEAAKLALVELAKRSAPGASDPCLPLRAAIAKAEGR